MRRFDCFPFNNELDMLECRLTELGDVVDTFVLVEATVTHGGNRPKPLHYRENQDRFAEWSDRIVAVEAHYLPNDADAWSREHAQREYIRVGLIEAGVEPDDLILQSDVDEIPRADVVANLDPDGYVVCEQDLYCFAVDWLHPQPWRGTVAAKYRHIGDRMAAMRDARLWAPTVIPDAGWHLSWLGGPEATQQKLDSFCHPEIDAEVRGHGWEHYLVDGWHVDNTKLAAVTDADWPRWVAERRCPESWWRP